MTLKQEFGEVNKLPDPLTGVFFFGKPKPPLGTVGVKAVNHCSASGFNILTLTTAKQYARVLFTFWI
nr:hypothetical protein [uncultured Mediterranean phage uvMED]